MSGIYSLKGGHGGEGGARLIVGESGRSYGHREQKKQTEKKGECIESKGLENTKAHYSSDQEESETTDPAVEASDGDGV